MRACAGGGGSVWARRGLCVHRMVSAGRVGAGLCLHNSFRGFSVSARCFPFAVWWSVQD